MDDKIALTQGDHRRLDQVRRHLFHITDMVFRPNAADEADRREPISESKLAKGEGVWSTYKKILGWAVDTLRQTIELPPNKAALLLDILDTARHQKRISVTACHRLLGQLRSMMLAISGGAGLFSQLQYALTHSRSKRVCLTTAARDHLNTLHLLALDVSRRPTRIAELFPVSAAHIVGATDAARHGMGGIAFFRNRAFVWRASFAKATQDQLASFDNPRGSITNSDLELAATIGHEGTLCHAFPLHEHTIHTGCDNIAATAWRNKGSATTQGAAAYLLPEASLQQRIHRHVPRVTYITGTSNLLADTASRRFDLSDNQLLTHLDDIAPQTQPWQMLRMPPELLLRLTSALHRQRRVYMLPVNAPVPPTASGPTAGSLFSPSLEWNMIPYSAVSLTKSPSYASLPNDFMTGAPAAAVSPSQLTMLLTKSSTSPKRFKNWGPRTHAATQWEK